MNFFKEEESDRLKDRQLERGGMNARKSSKKPIGAPNTFGKKPGKKYDGMSALEKVKADIRAKHGHGAIKEDAKMGKQSDEKLAALHKQVSGADQSLPSNQFMLKRVTKEMNRRKKATKTEGYAPGDVDQKVGAVTPIPKKDQDDARARILAKAKAKRAARLKSEGVILEGKKKCKECKGKGCSHCKDKGYMVTHDCSQKIEHAEWGIGECISEMHTLDEQGNITHYDILFEHGVEQDVPVELLTTLISEVHEHAINDDKNEIVEKKGLWANIHAKRKRGEKPAKKGDKDYPETLKVESALDERADMWHPDPEKDKKLGGPGANARAREDSAAKSKPKADPKKLKDGESYMDYSKRQKASNGGKTVSTRHNTAVGRLNKMGANIKPKERKRDKIGKAIGKALDKIGGIKREEVTTLSFSAFLAEGNATGRMMQKSKTQVTGHISADRGSDEKKNRAGRKGLEKDLKKHGIGHKKGVGEYKYDSGETGREVSYQTSKPDKMSKRRFGKVMRRMGRKHGQESVITKDKDKSAKLHYTEKGSKAKSDSIGKTKAGKHPEGYGETSGTKARSGKLPKKTTKGAYHYG